VSCAAGQRCCLIVASDDAWTQETEEDNIFPLLSPLHSDLGVGEDRRYRDAPNGTEAREEFTSVHPSAAGKGKGEGHGRRG